MKQAIKKSPLKILNGLFLEIKNLLLLFALFGFLILFFGAIRLFVVHLAAAVAAGESSS